MPLILASTSPRRHELLALLGIPFDVKSPSFEERLVAGRPAIGQVQSFAQGKAQSVAKQEPEAIVLGSDTVIELDHDVLGKPPVRCSGAWQVVIITYARQSRLSVQLVR